MSADGLVVAGLWLTFALASGYPLFCLLATFGRHAVRLDWIELVFTSTLLGSLVIGWSALLLAEVGIFSLHALAGMLMAVSATTLFGLKARRGELRPAASTPSPTAWLILLLLALAVVTFFHPAEFILGGADAGVYVNLGANIARTGSLLIHEEGLADLPSSVWPGLFREMPSEASVRYVRLPGFYLSDEVPDLIIPQFFALHPVWLAICNSLLGLRASLYVTPLWASLGVVALGLAVRRAFDRHVGLLAAFLLLITPTQIYFARYPTSEPLTQFLLWGGLYAFVAFLANEHPLWGVMSGLALGQVFLARIDALPLLLLPMAWLVYSVSRRQLRAQLPFFAPFGLVLLHTIIHTAFFSWPYAWDVYGGVWTIGVYSLQQDWWFLVALLLGGGAFLWAALRFPMITSGSHEVMRWAGSGVLATLALLAYFVWPRIGHAILYPDWYSGGTIPVQNHLNLVRAAWYLSPLGVWLAVAGVALMLARREGRRAWPILLIGLSFSIVYLYRMMNDPFHIFTMRRYVPVVFPFFAAGMAYALVWSWEQRRRWRLAGPVSWLLGLVLVGWLGYNNRAVWNLVEYRGLIDQVESLSAELEAGAVLLFDDEAPVGAGSTVGTPLQYLHGFTAFDLQEEKLDPNAALATITDWQADGRTVYWVMGPSPSRVAEGSLRLAPATGFWIDVSQLEGSYDHFPVRRQHNRVSLEFYSVIPKDMAGICDFPLYVDIGTLDSLYARSGFHDKELWGGLSVRWTAGEAVLNLPCLPDALPEVVSLAAHVASARPDHVPAARIVWEVDSTPIGEWEVDGDFQVDQTLVPGEMLRGSGHTLTMRTNTWVPKQCGVGEDSRTLGVVVDWITISTKEHR